MARINKKKQFGKFVLYIILSILVHFVIIKFLIPDRLNKKLNSKKIHIVLKKRKFKKKKKKKVPEFKNKQIVDVIRPDKEIKPKKAKYLAKYNTRVKKELKAKKKNRIIKKNIDNKDTKIKKLKILKNHLNKKLKKQNKTAKNINIDKNAKANLRENSKQSNEKIKINFSDLQFSQMLKSSSNDYLKKVKEGEYTSLNTLAYEYTGYFIKIKNRVAKNWNPEAAYQKYDPYRKLYGIKDRYTLLKVTIKKDGYLKEIKIQKSSGLSFLDKEAVKAFEKGQPYKIVPKGLLKGKESFTILFGFYVDNPSSPRVFYIKR